MFRPKIKKHLLPELRRISRKTGKTMTQVVNELLKKAIVKPSFAWNYLQVKEATHPAASPGAVAALFRAESKIDRECFWVVPLNNANKVIEKELVAVGTVNTSVIKTREVFKKAITNGAVGIVTVHNHPGDTAYPSSDDKNVWCKLDEAGNIVGITVLDHLIIVPSGGFFSRKDGYATPCKEKRFNGTM